VLSHIVSVIRWIGLGPGDALDLGNLGGDNFAGDSISFDIELINREVEPMAFDGQRLSTVGTPLGLVNGVYLGNGLSCVARLVVVGAPERGIVKKLGVSRSEFEHHGRAVRGSNGAHYTKDGVRVIRGQNCVFLYEAFEFYTVTIETYLGPREFRQHRVLHLLRVAWIYPELNGLAGVYDLWAYNV
jgi:hypothetical protein